MLSASELRTAFNFSPKAAISYFEQKGYVISWNWQAVSAQTHAQAFTVAKAARLDILELIRGELSSALKNGETANSFVQRLTPLLQKKGWWGKQVIVNAAGDAEKVQLGSPYRLKNIYRINTQSAYMAGRYQAQMASRASRPFWQYVAVMDEHTRASHAALNGRVFATDDPIWQTHYPPNDWGCRCRVRALSQRRLDSMGLKVESSAGKLSSRSVETGVDQRTGEIYHATVTTYQSGSATMTPAAGWNHNVGQLVYGTDIALMQKIIALSDLPLRTAAVQSINNSALRHQAFAAWVDTVLAKVNAGHEAQVLGFMDEAVAAAVAQRIGQSPARILVLNEKQLLHADSSKHEIGGIALTRDQLKGLPRLLSEYDAVYWDKKHHNIVYVKYDGEGAQVFMPVNPYYGIKKIKGRFDVVVNAFKVVDSRLFNSQRFERLQ